MKRASIDGKEIAFLEKTEDGVLGYSVWYTFSRTIIHKDTVKEWFNRHGLSEFTPGDPDHRDAFKRICSEYREKKIGTVGNTEVFLLIRPVDKAGNVRKLVIERRSEGKRLSYDVVGEIEYLKDDKRNTGEIRHNLEVSNPDVEKVVEEIKKRWDKEKDCYTEEHLRRALLKIIDRSGKVRLKPSGGIYFVPAEDFTYIEKFAKIVEEIKKEYPDNNTEIWYAPIINTDYYRDMVKTKVEDSLQNTLDSVINRLVELANDDELDENEKLRRIRELAATIENTAKVAEKYSTLLRTSLNRIERLLENARTILDKVNRYEQSQLELTAENAV